MDRHVFVDIDGVCAEFDDFAHELWGKYPQDMTDPELWGYVNSYQNFWIDLPLKPYAHDMIKFIKETFGDYTFLTGCPKTNSDFASEQKKLWVQKHFDDAKIITCFSKNKPLHMRNPGDILIDDFVANVKRWEKAGGVAILHRNGERTIEKLKALLAVDDQTSDE